MRQISKVLAATSGSMLLGLALTQSAVAAATAPGPMRPTLAPRKAPLAEGPKRFVDAARGDDASDGSQAKPWKTLTHALRQLTPGDTLYLRGGVYYEKVALTKSGTEDKPITIASYPGESAIVDGGLREFIDDPAGSWKPYKEGAEGEYISTRTYPDADARRAPTQFLPAAWEPFAGIEDERPLALGHFADSMVPLHGYRTAVDLRSKNEFWLGGKHEGRDVGNYCGPGLWYNRATGRIHVRLAPPQLAGLGENGYRGETDPRKLKLVVAVGFGEDVLRIVGVNHVKLRDLVLRGATGSPMINMYGSQHIELDHLSVFGGFPALLVNASQNIRLAHSAFRGLAAPWTSRAHMKYRGTASYEIVLQNNQPLNENLEMAWCEFTDGHDFAFMKYVKNLQFHHNLVDNFNDDGIEYGPKMRDHTLFIYQNRIGRILLPLSLHENVKDESPLDHDPMSGSFVFRNVFDQRGGTYKSPPKEADSTGAYLYEEGHLTSDHGGPIWPVTRFYHNTFLRETPIFRNAYLFGLATNGLRHNERDVFNNIFMQTGAVPGVGFVATKSAENLREGGNLMWGVEEGPQVAGDPFAKFRASPLFEQSRAKYEAGWTTHDRFADPRFAKYPTDRRKAPNLRLQSDSPAVNSGLAVPAEWPDPLRSSDSGKPDIGAIPLNAEVWGVGVDGRLSPFGEDTPSK